MLKKFIATLSVVAFVAAASAGTITVSLQEVPIVAGSDALVPNGLDGYVCVDLKVTMTDDIWTTAGADATLTNGTFWEHPAGQDIQPQDLFLGLYGYLKYDSFWTTSEEFPNTNLDPDAQATNFAPGNPSVKNATHRVAEWYVDPESPAAPNNGVFTIARYTFLPGASPELHVIGTVFIESLGGTEIPYDVIWTPEPASLSLLALGGLALIRRR